MKNRFDNFDDFAVDYRSVHNENIKISGADSDYFSEYKVKEISQFFDCEQPLIILDLGCGDGNSAKYFREYFPNSVIYGLDISEKSIEIAKQRRLNHCEFLVYDGERIPMVDQQIDLILLAGVLHHVQPSHRVNLIKEVYRVLKKEGQLFVFEHNPYNPLTQKIVKDCPFDEDAILLTSSQCQRIFSHSGFKKSKTRYTIFFPRWTWLQRILKLESYLRWCFLGGQYYVQGIK